MPVQLLILADDLTGAADTAVQFARRKISSAVLFANDHSGYALHKQVLAIDTESRHCTPEAAFGRVTAAVIEAKTRGIGRFYKKIDSTFRGNVGAELEALIQASGVHRLMLAPAFPRGGRTTRNGRQYVGDTLLHETAFAQDPHEPMTESHIPAILARQTSYPVHCIDRKALDSFDAANERRSGIFVFDAETDDDLAVIAQKCTTGNAPTAFAGAAAFAEMLVTTLRINGSESTRARFFDRIFVVNGSLHQVSAGQVSWARRSGMFCSFLPPSTATATGSATDGEVTERIIYRLNADGQALLSTPFVRHPDTTPGAFAAALGRAAATIMERVPDVNLVVMGGDTAYAVCKALDIRILFPHAEILPGLTMCTHDTKAFPGPLILKSGGFGPDNTVGLIRTFISGAIRSTNEML
jgi:uncharacterized protein YgbK (DUF1537 family)